jgi:hypothetical protein
VVILKEPHLVVFCIVLDFALGLSGFGCFFLGGGWWLGVDDRITGLGLAETDFVARFGEVGCFFLGCGCGLRVVDRIVGLGLRACVFVGRSREEGFAMLPKFFFCSSFSGATRVSTSFRAAFTPSCFSSKAFAKSPIPSTLSFSGAKGMSLL